MTSKKGKSKGRGTDKSKDKYSGLSTPRWRASVEMTHLGRGAKELKRPVRWRGEAHTEPYS